MIEQYTPNAETWALFDAACGGELAPDQVEHLEAALRSDQRLCDFYLDYFNLHAELTRSIRLEHVREKIVDAIQHPNSTSSISPPPTTDAIPFPSLSPLPSPPSPSFVGGPVFSYMVASVVLCLMLFGAWAYKISHDRDFHIVTNSRRSTTSGLQDRPQLVFVGQITGVKDCRWANEDTQTVVGAFVSLDREYALASGLLEITYKSGARVILEGPCTYKIESSTSGFLDRGKLTARIIQQGPAASAAGAKPQAAFSITTPTALITDLGTEFGVEVDQSGNTRAHVFQGVVELKFQNADGKKIAHRLTRNESIRVTGQDRDLKVTRRNGEANDFVRFISNRVRIELFNTGFKLKEGEADQHWSIAAVSYDPNYKSRPAAVTATPPYDRWLWNSPGVSQWISTETGPVEVPKGTYTFRTEFELKGMKPETAVLRIAFLADNHVNAIRLNGRNLKVPEHGYDIPFSEMIQSTAKEGFVAGANVLEIDVFNGGGNNPTPDEPSPMGLRVELEGYVFTGPSDDAEQRRSATKNHPQSKGE